VQVRRSLQDGTTITVVITIITTTPKTSPGSDGSWPLESGAVRVLVSLVKN
jgi:hypothetical protein